LIVLGLSVISSRLAEKNKILTQEVVLLKKRVNDLEKFHDHANEAPRPQSGSSPG